MRVCTALLFWLLIQHVGTAIAQQPAGAASALRMQTKAAPAATTPVTCNDDLTAALTAGRSVALHILETDGSPSDEDMVWQPPNGTITFTLPQDGFTRPDMQDTLMVCFKLQGQPFRSSPQIALESIDAATGQRTYTARLPAELTVPVPHTKPAKFINAPRTAIVARDGTMRVVLLRTDGTASVAMDRDIGITSAWLAGLLALIAALLAFAFVWGVAASFKVPGTWFLKIISTRRGFASLSQFQVILWTFVVGTGAVYVMALSGDLISISNGTLILLGIAGAVTATSKLQSAQSDTRATTGSVAATARRPDKIESISIVGVTESEIVLAWAPASTGGRPRSYLVEYRVAEGGGGVPATWLAVAETLTRPRFRVLNLSADCKYAFRVTPINEYDRGDPSEPVTERTRALITQEGAPEQVAGLQASTSIAGVFSLAWSRVEGAEQYRVQHRRHNSDEEWRGITTNEIAASITASDSDSEYDFRVAAIAGEIMGAWSRVLTARPLRSPRWADLVVNYDGANEIDVTRMQMLFFTVVTALFVGLKIVSGYAIPEIPEGYLLLMGISNGIYLTAKFVPG